MNDVKIAPRAPKQKIVSMAWLIKYYSVKLNHGVKGSLRKRQVEKFLGQRTDRDGRQNCVGQPPH